VTGAGDWLEKLATAAAGGTTGHEDGQERKAPSGDELTRAGAVKLGVAGVASLSLGLWRASAGLAVDPPELTPEASRCFAGCFIDWGKSEKKGRATCDEIIGKTLQDEDTGWGRFKVAFPFFGIAYAKAALKGLCYSSTDGKARQDWADCNAGCVQKCSKPSPRSLQDASRRNQVCEPDPPPPPYAPEPPPAPNPAEDPCWACEDPMVGGMCCGPYTFDPQTGTYGICGCVDAAVGCPAVGCA
jgi:hypothetical protein